MEATTETQTKGDFASGWFTLTELQKRLELKSRAELRKSIQQKQIPFTPFGREILFTNDDFVAWLKANSTTGKSPRGTAD